MRCKDCLRLDPDHEFDCYHTVFLTSSEVARLKALAAPYDTEGIPHEDSNSRSNLQTHRTFEGPFIVPDINSKFLLIHQLAIIN